MNKIERIKELVKELNGYRDSYYNKNISIISDKEYDSLFDELKALEDSTGYILTNSPTQEVGYIVQNKLQKRRHPTLLKSLSKTKSIDELNKFKGDKEAILMLKADGLTVEVDYENGSFVGAYTRGNGEIGEDITHNAFTFKNIPMQIPFEGRLRLVGEAVIHWGDFNKINEALSEEEKYATPRNLCSGSVRQLNNRICDERNVYWYAFGVLEATDAEMETNVLFDSKNENFKWIDEIGFDIIPHMIASKTIKNDYDIEMMKSSAVKLGIPIDGMVLTFDSIKYSESLGQTAHHPLHSIAFKFSDEIEETILRSVEWNTTRSGQINPTACFDTVILDNTEVSRASLFNLTFIKELQLNLTNTIAVSKRNMIIPYIEENLDRQEGNYISIPEKCPSCSCKTEIRNTGTADFLFCTNDNCPAKLLDKFCHFVSRDAMNIDGLSEATLEKFINKGWLKTFDDIYKLSEHKNEIINMEGFGYKSYTKLIEAIENSKNVEFSSLIYSLGIDQIGKGGSKRLAKHFSNDINKFINAINNNYDFSVIEDFGNITSESLIDYFKDENNVNTFNWILYYVKIKQEEAQKVNTNNFFSGKKVYCTGSFASHKKEELQNILESLGAEFASGYAKSLDYLIVGSLKGSGKVDKALKDGVPVMQEEEFLKLIGKDDRTV